MQTYSPIALLWNHFSTKRRQIVIASSFSVLNKIFDIAPPLLIGLAVDTVVKKESSFIATLLDIDHLETQIYILGLLTFIIWALESVFEYLLKIWWRGLAQEVQHSLRVEGHQHLQSLPLSFFEEQNTGNLMTILNDDINQLERFLDMGANQIIQVLTTVLSIGVIFFIISPSIAALSFLPVPFILWGSFYFQKRIAPRYLNVREKAGHIASYLNNNILGIATVKSYVAEKFESQKMRQESLSYEQANKKAIILSSAFSPLIRMVVLCGFMFALIIGGLQTLEGTLEVGAYSILIFLTQRLLWPLTGLGEIFDLYQRAMASTLRIFQLLQTQISQQDGELNLTSSDLGQGIHFQNVSFNYQNSTDVLKNISFSIHPGQTIAFVGATGSGKSTLVKLLLRFYDPQKGEIKIGEHNINQYKIEDLRQAIAYVAQSPYLFFGSVKENVMYGSFGAGQEDFQQACLVAEAQEFISKLPQKENTLIGEQGQKLSGGQRQRLSIARSLLKNAPIYIFDEATSAVDNETEAAIQRSLKKVTSQKTTIIIAHRLSTIIHADCIHVLHDGQIVESGHHQELLQKKGLYHSLWSVQSGQNKTAGV